MSTNSKRLFTNPQILQESDKLDFLTAAETDDSERLRSIISEYLRHRRSRMVAYLGPFGSGKSIIIKQALGKIPNAYSHTFDIWQRHDDRSIWDAFTITTTAAITADDAEDIAQAIDGKPSDGVALIFRHPIISLLLAFILYFIFAHLIWTAFRDNEFVQPFLIYAMPTFFSVVALFGITAIFPQTKSPATRTLQYENKLTEHLTNLDKPLIVVVEGIDRSEYSQHFLETLHVYLHNLPALPYPVIVLCPQRSESIGLSDKLAPDQLERCTKIYDEVINSFIEPAADVKTVAEILNRAGCIDQDFAKTVLYIVDAVDGSSQPMSIRTIKFAVRETCDFARLYPKAEPSTAFILAISKYLSCNSGQRISLCLRSLIETDGMSIDDTQSLSQLMRLVADLIDGQTTVNNTQPIQLNGTYLQLLF